MLGKRRLTAKILFHAQHSLPSFTGELQEFVDAGKKKNPHTQKRIGFSTRPCGENKNNCKQESKKCCTSDTIYGRLFGTLGPFWRLLRPTLTIKERNLSLPTHYVDFRYRLLIHSDHPLPSLNHPTLFLFRGLSLSFSLVDSLSLSLWWNFW